MKQRFEAMAKDLENGLRIRENRLVSEFSARKVKLENELREKLSAGESETTKLKEELYANFKLQQDALNEEKQYVDGILKRNETEYRDKIKLLAERENVFSVREDELRAKFGDELARKSAQFETEIREIRLKAENERAELAEDIRAREARAGMEHHNELKGLLEEIRSKDEKIRAIEKEHARSESEWAEKIAAVEHDIVTNKVSQLEEQYRKHKADLEEKTGAERSRLESEAEQLRSEMYQSQEALSFELERERVKIEEMFHKRVVEHDSDMQVMREGFEKEREQLRLEISSREIAISALESEKSREKNDLVLRMKALREESDNAIAAVENAFRTQLSEKDAAIGRLKDEAFARETEWNERLRALERDVIEKKVSELEFAYLERKTELESGFAERQKKAENASAVLMAGLTENLNRQKQAFEQEKAVFGQRLSEREAALEHHSAAVSRELAEREKALAERSEADHSEILRLSSELENVSSRRIEKIRQDFMGQKAAIEKKYNQEKEELARRYEDILQKKTAEHGSSVKTMREAL
ncbi:MAG TPA: hypothetical protein VJC03_05365, partial [bacterium]|nr:hypothetical protein [bacterium]